MILLNYENDVCWRGNLGKRRLGKDGKEKRWNRKHAKKGNPANWGDARGTPGKIWLKSEILG
ncbi:MAG: hypothetical protein DMG76_00785 [Acidobacteria bacterium]|nr:MAG: hypothetical protein DMG76_00785 [Acidobacteriota bacterium]